MATATGWDVHRVTVIAHRGASSEAPENTLAAFDAAVDAATAAGAVPWIELDLQRTIDEGVVVFHDDALERTTDGEGRVGEHTVAELQLLDAGSRHDPRFAGERIPSLDDLTAWLVANPTAHVLVEYKGRWRPKHVSRTLVAFEHAGVADRLVLQSFDPRTVNALKQRAGDFARGLLLDSTPHHPAELMLAELLDVSALNPGWERALGDEHLVDRAHGRLGAQVAVWTPDEPEVWRRLVAAGVDAIITNRPRRLHEWLADQSSGGIGFQERSR